MTRPWLSVVMPTYNGERYIEASLASIAEEADSDVECIVVDDGSTDRTLDIAHAFCERLNLRIVEGSRRGSWVATTNEGLAIATAPHACFLHQDDRWYRGRLPLVRSLLSRVPDAAMVFHAARYVDEHGDDLGSWRAPFRGDGPVRDSLVLQQRLLVQNFVCIAAPVFRRALVVDSGGLDEALWYTADWDLWLRLVSSGPVAYAGDALVGFRVHPESQTVQRSLDLDDFERQLTTVLERHLDNLAVPVSTSVRVERLARASIATNVALASAAHGDRSRLPRVAASVARLGPAGWYRLGRDARLVERVGSRLRAQLHGRG